MKIAFNEFMKVQVYSDEINYTQGYQGKNANMKFNNAVCYNTIGKKILYICRVC